MKFYIKIFAVFALVIGFTLFIKKYYDPSKRVKSVESSFESKNDFQVVTDDVFARRAYIISQDFVKGQLKSPSTADFPTYDYSFNRLSQNEIIINGYVDASNSYGAMMRNNFKIRLKFKGGEWNDNSNWILIDLIFY